MAERREGDKDIKGLKERKRNVTSNVTATQKDQVLVSSKRRPFFRTQVIWKE
jgi:hypothetical protein